MTAFRTRLLATLESVRKVPPRIGTRTVKVRIVRRWWSGGKRGAGDMGEELLVDLPLYRVRNMTSKEVSDSGGRFAMEDLKVGPITPSAMVDENTVNADDTAMLPRVGPGFRPTDLQPKGRKGDEIVYVLSGSIEGDYELQTLQSEKAFSYWMVIRRIRTTP